MTKDEIIRMTSRRVGRHIAEGQAMGFDTPDAEEYRAIVEANSDGADWFEQIFTESDTPESKLRSEKEDRFMREVIYAGLTDLNTGFDSPLIGHFSPEDFLIVIDRCESLGVRIIGIEVSTTDVEPPWKVGLVDIEISPVPGYDWARRLLRKYIEKSDITISATFDVPDALLKSIPTHGGEPNQ